MIIIWDDQLVVAAAHNIKISLRSPQHITTAAQHLSQTHTVHISVITSVVSSALTRRKWLHDRGVKWGGAWRAFTRLGEKPLLRSRSALIPALARMLTCTGVSYRPRNDNNYNCTYTCANSNQIFKVLEVVKTQISCYLLAKICLSLWLVVQLNSHAWCQ